MTHLQAFLIGAISAAAVLVNLALWLGPETAQHVVREALGGVVWSVALVAGPSAVGKLWMAFG